MFGLCLPSRSRRLSRDPGDCLSFVPVWFGRIGLLKGFLVRDGRRWLSNTEEEVLGVGDWSGAERVLADAITIDGRKEWTCKFCSETNVWTRGALQVLREQHLHGFARQPQAGELCEE